MMMFDFTQLRCFVTVAEELHFGRAAERLCMTQPPLTRHIQLLEHALGVQLFERTSRRVQLTMAGRVFLSDARRIISFTEQAAESARRVGKGDAGRVTVGFTAVAGYALVPDIVAAARIALPDIDFVLKEMVSADQLDALEARTIDLGFLRPLGGHTAVKYQFLAREPLLLAVPMGHRLARPGPVTAEDLHRERFIMYSQNEGRYFYDLIVGLFGNSGAPPDYVQHMGQTHSILGLVRARLGVAIVPASARQFYRDALVFKPIWRADVFAEIYLAWHPGHSNPALDTVLRFVTEPPAMGTR
jgi:DNA-binding transcriptional LysR family regulator